MRIIHMIQNTFNALYIKKQNILGPLSIQSICLRFTSGCTRIYNKKFGNILYTQNFVPNKKKIIFDRTLTCFSPYFLGVCVQIICFFAVHLSFQEIYCFTFFVPYIYTKKVAAVMCTSFQNKFHNKNAMDKMQVFYTKVKRYFFKYITYINLI